MIWNKKEIGSELIREITKKYGCDALMASILVRRNILDGKDILFYLEDDTRYLYNAFLFKNMEDAVDRILDAKDEGERVLIFGDRDADGITSTTILYQALTSLGIETSYRIPTGDESYGLSIDAIDAHAANYGSLIITVDCGISNCAEIAYASQKGIDVIVVDHHMPQDEIPPATVIINPKMPDSGYPNSDLSGCAVTWKLILALRFGLKELYKQQICLLNVRPVNQAYCVEGIKLINMVEVDRISETIIPGMINFSNTRLRNFLSDQQIFVWDAPLQLKQLEKMFGSGIEFQCFDLQPEMIKYFPQLKDKSLVRLKEFSRIGRYEDSPFGEIETFCNLFITFIQQGHSIYGAQESKELQLVALSTLADLMPLQGENRILVKRGLAAINKKPIEGLEALLGRQNLLGKKIGTGDIGWYVSPLINATGRMGSPGTSLELLLAKDSIERGKKTEEIFQMNERRKELGTEGWNIVIAMAQESFDKFNERLVVVTSDKIHRGITGILANKLSNTFNVPSIVICLMNDDTAVASLRSAREYSLLGILESCSDLLIHYGGHPFAAGFGIKKANIAQLYERLKVLSHTIEFGVHTEGTTLTIDAELPHKFMTPDILSLIDKFEPYGESFPSLLFMAKEMKILTANSMGKTEKQHLKLTLDCGIHKWTAIYWGAADKLDKDFKVGDLIDAVFTVGRNSFNGVTLPQMIIQDIKRG